MATTEQLLKTLKALLKSKGISYAMLAKHIHLSEASVKRLFADKTFSLQRVEDICQVLDIDFYELARIARGEKQQLAYLSYAQEQLLAENRQLLGLFYMLLNEWQLDEIVNAYDITEAACIAMFIKLEKAGLIDLMTNNKVKLKVVKHLRHRPDGPIRQQLRPLLTDSFLGVRFDEYGGAFRFEVAEMSHASANLLQRKIDRLAAEFYELSEIDLQLPKHQRTLYGLAMGIRPWNDAEELAGFKRRK